MINLIICFMSRGYCDKLIVLLPKNIPMKSHLSLLAHSWPKSFSISSAGPVLLLLPRHRSPMRQGFAFLFQLLEGVSLTDDVLILCCG